MSKPLEEFMEKLNMVTRYTLTRCEKVGVNVKLVLSPVKVPLAERVTFIIPPAGKKDKPITLFSTIARASALARPKMVGDGYFGRIMQKVKEVIPVESKA